MTDLPGRHIRLEIRDMNADLVRVRRDLHRHPELSWKEERTGQVIRDQLATIDGLDDIRTVAKTGATALVGDPSRGPTILWRADIDALPIPEKSGVRFASETENVMHACGHDVHVAAALGIARTLAARADSLPGAVRFLFQPAEEASGGAQACVADGVLSSPKVDRVLGFHVSADLPLGTINVAPGPFFASPTSFRIEITGRGGHGASPHQGIDSVVVAAHVITALQTVVSRSAPPHEQAVLTVGKVESGYRGNVIAESATLTGTIRTYNDLMLSVMLTRAEEIIAGVCQAFGATHTFTHDTSCPPVVNDEAVTAFVKEQAAHFLGETQIFGIPAMGADDMSVFLQERPGCYFWLGARNEREGVAGRHHDPGFIVDEEVIPLAVEFGTRLVEGSLEALGQPAG